MKRFGFLTLAVVAVLGFCTTSCTKDANEEAGYASIELTSTNALTINTQVHDTSAAYPLNFSVSIGDGGYLVVTGGTSSPDVSLNIPATTVCATTATIADYGKVRKLDKIESYPESTEFESKVLCEEGHGYVVKAYGSANLSAYGNPAIHDPAAMYVRIYVSEATDNGFKIYYQYPFIPVED